MRTKTQGKRLTAMLLTLVMLFSMCVSASAAGTDDAYVSIDVDGTETYSSSRTASGTQDILVTGARELESLSVNGNSISKNVISATAASAESRFVNGYDATSGNYKVYTEIVNGVRVIRLNWANLSSSLIVEAETTTHGNYTVSTSVTPSAACEFTADAVMEITAGGKYVCDFMPASERQEVQTIVVTVNGVKREISVPLTQGASATATVGGQDVLVTLMSDGTVRVTVDRVTSDLSVNAQVYNKSTRYELSVITDTHVSSSVSSEVLNAGSARNIILTPGRDYNVGEIVITANGMTGRLGINDTRVTVNQVVYRATRDSDGTVTLSVPSLTSDVEIQVMSDQYGAHVEVLPGDMTSEQEGVNWVKRGEPFAVRFNARRNTVLTSIRVVTSSGTFKADTNDDYLVINGKYFPIYRNTDGDVTINFTQVPGNMTIEAISRDTVHDVKVTTDSRIEADVNKTTEIDDGDDMDVTFSLKDSSKDYDIRQIRVTYDGKTYKADPYNDKYVTVDGERWYFRSGSDGQVTLEMTDIQADVAVYATTVKNSTSSGSSSGDGYRITKNPDSHSNITFTGKQPFDDGDDTTIRVYTDNKYIIKSVRVSINNKSATVNPFDETMKIDGETYKLTWKSNMDMSFEVPSIYANVTVNATSVKGTEKLPDGSSSGSGTNTPDDSWTITVKPGTGDASTSPDTSGNANLGVSGYHKAYMYGYGDNMFRPDNSITRAQTIAILCRLYSGISDSDFKAYAGTPGFQDVNPNSTFAGYIGYAKQQGYLAAIVGSGLNLQPQKAITRAEFCALLCAFTNQNLVGVSTVSRFSDVPNTHWAIVYVNYCAERSWANGYSNGLFQPDSSLTRAQMCVMLNRINNRSVSTTPVGYPIRNFNDVPTNHWAYADIIEATHNHSVASVSNGTETWASV